MNITLSYDNQDAQAFSKKGNPIRLHAFGLQGVEFSRGQIMQIGTGSIRCYTGVTITSIEPNVLGLIVPVADALVTLASATTVFKPSSTPISLNVRAANSSSILEYGDHIADLYFLQGAE